MSRDITFNMMDLLRLDWIASKEEIDYVNLVLLYEMDIFSKMLF